MASEQVSTELLRGFSPLDGLKRDNLAALARKVQIREMSPGQLLFKEGDTEKRTLYILSGILELVENAGGLLKNANPGSAVFRRPDRWQIAILPHEFGMLLDRFEAVAGLENGVTTGAGPADAEVPEDAEIPG